MKVSAIVFALFMFLCPGGLKAAGAADAAAVSEVLDLAGVLRPQAIAELRGLLRDSEAVTGRQIVIGVVPSYSGTAAADFARGAYVDWQVGQRGKPGALLLLSAGDRDVQMMAGEGFEYLLPFGVQRRIVAEVAAPPLKAGNAERALVDGAMAMVAALEGMDASTAPAAGSAIAATPAVAAGSGGGFSPLTSLVLLYVLFKFFRFRSRSGLSYMRGGIFGRGLFGGPRRRW